MSNVISQYYLGLVQQLRSEVDNINSLFNHQGVKGQGNEAILRELLTKFIPKRYAVGTGIVIDQDGNQSRQCDIIIYDALLYPSLLALTTVHFFPVDIVYAIIEVKTTLDSSKAKEALDNIASVRNLHFVPGSFAYSQIQGDAWGLGKYISDPPMGFVFAYNSDAQQFETFKNWFSPSSETEISTWPALVGCLDQGILAFENQSGSLNPRPDTTTNFAGWMIYLDKGFGEPVEFSEPRENYTQEGIVYPVKRAADKYVVIDQGRVLLLFLQFLHHMLSFKRINPEINFINHYFKNTPILWKYHVK